MERKRNSGALSHLTLTLHRLKGRHDAPTPPASYASQIPVQEPHLIVTAHRARVTISEVVLQYKVGEK